MPKYRKLHTKIIDSFDFNEMPNDFTRVCWLLLIVGVDSEGRGIDNPAWIHSKILPMRSDIDYAAITLAFDWLAERGMIVRYQVANRHYFYIPSFKKYQSGTEKEAASVLPDPCLVESNSGVSQEKVESNLTASVSAPVYASVSASVSESEYVKEATPFEIYTQWFREVTGIDQGGKTASDAVNALLEFHPIKEDMQEGYKWITRQKPVKYWGQLVGPTRTAQSKRIASGNGQNAIPPGYEKADEYN